jgi:7-cyano-7-deazaguanine synthase
MAEDGRRKTDDRSPPKAVVLLSGGLDSTVAAAIAGADGFEVHALTVRYGQRHAVELEAATRVAHALGVASHRIVDLDLRAIGGSSLTADIAVPHADSHSSQPTTHDVPVPPDSHDSQPTTHDSPIPPTYVPARNTIMLGLALAHAEVLGARDIYIGVSSVDYSGYPDCRPEFVEAFERLAQLATKAGVEGSRFRIHAPLQHLTKADTVRRGLSLGVDFSLTHTCYDPSPDGAACGTCDSCRLRRDAFRDAGVPDPTRYATSTADAGSLLHRARQGAAEPDVQLRGGAPRAVARGAGTTLAHSTVRVLEIYRTIQGETTYAGVPCVIVRLAGCPLRCSYCDTAYARDAEGMELVLDEVLASVQELGPGIVAVTGGEPLAQKHGADLLRALADEGRTVLLETSGAFDASGIDPRVRRIIDVKTPGSAMTERNIPSNWTTLRPIDELKFVLVDRADYEWSRELVRREKLDAKCTVLFSAARGKLDPAELAKWILSDGLPVRLQVQLHRILWPDRDRGV